MLKSTVIFGLDILGRTIKGNSSTLFSLVVLTENHIDKYPKITRQMLFRKLYDLKPDYVAMDNIFELTPNAQGVVRFLEKIPAITSLIQVTGNPRTGMEKLQVLANKHEIKKDLSFPHTAQKLNSLETAEICARLCQKHVGYEILAFEDEIRIVISKKKSHGKGGWSAPRYERISKSAVNQAATEVERILRQYNVTWEFYEYPQRRVYLVLLDMELITEIKSSVKSLTTDLVRVTLERITKPTLDFQPLDVNLAPEAHPLKNVIVGIDPGTTTGIAVLDIMNGYVLYLGSKRECGISEIIRISSKYGKVVCIAADVIPVPATVEKIAKMTGAKIFSPTTLVSSAQKREYLHDFRNITSQFVSGHLNSHERDALFGALKAFNNLRDQISKIQRTIHESYPELISNLNEIQRLVLGGNSISNAINLVSEKKTVLESPLRDDGKDHLTNVLKDENEKLQLKIEAVYDELNQLDKEANYWRNLARENTLEIKKLKDKLEKDALANANRIHQKISEAVTREVGRIRTENQELRRRIRSNEQEMEKLKQIKNFWVKGREIPLKVIKSFSEDSIRDTERNYGLHEGDIVLVLNPTGGGAQTAQKLIDLGIRGILIPKDGPNFSDQALQQFTDNCLPYLQLPLKEFSSRTRDFGGRNLEIWEYDGLYLSDITIKEEIRKMEFKMRDYLRQKRLLLIPSHGSQALDESGFDIDKILKDFKEKYIALHTILENEKYSPSSEEE